MKILDHQSQTGLEKSHIFGIKSMQEVKTDIFWKKPAKTDLFC